MIINIKYSILSQGQLHSIAEAAVYTVGKVDLVLMDLEYFYNKVSSNLLTFQAAIQRDTRHPLTEKIKGADIGRDKRFLGFKGYVDICKYSSNPDVVEAAEEIDKIIDKYGRHLHLLGYDDQSTKMKALITELNEAENAALITTCGAETVFNEMVVAYEAMQTLLKEKIDLDKNTVTFLQSRKPLIRSLQSLISYIELKATMINTEEWTNLIADLNRAIEGRMFRAKVSEGHDTNDTEEENPEEGVETPDPGIDTPETGEE